MATSFLDVATPSRTPARGGLLRVANVIDTSDAHILQGLQYSPDPCDLPLLTPGSCWVTENPVETNKTFEGIGDPVTSPLTFVLHAAVECFIGPDSDFDERARRVLDFGESVVIERVLHDALLDAETAIGTEGSLNAAAARAEQWLGANYPGLGLLHMDRRAAALLGNTEISPAFVLTTKQGTPIANGAGYGPADGAGADPFDIFATGQVNIWRSGITSTESNDLPMNTAVALVERAYAITVDCGLMAKVTVDVTP